MCGILIIYSIKYLCIKIRISPGSREQWQKALSKHSFIQLDSLWKRAIVVIIMCEMLKATDKHILKRVRSVIVVDRQLDSFLSMRLYAIKSVLFHAKFLLCQSYSKRHSIIGVGVHHLNGKCEKMKRETHITLLLSFHSYCVLLAKFRHRKN